MPKIKKKATLKFAGYELSFRVNYSASLNWCASIFELRDYRHLLLYWASVSCKQHKDTWILEWDTEAQAAVVGSPEHAAQTAVLLSHQKPASHTTPHGPTELAPAGDEFGMTSGQQYRAPVGLRL